MQPLTVHSGIYQTCFIAAVIVFAVQQFPALWSTLQLRGRGGSATSDQGSYMVVQIGVLSCVILGLQTAMHLTGATITWHRPLIVFLGIALIVLGSVISWFAVRQLGHYFTVVVAVRPGQPVIQSGLYRVIRHPSYTGQLLAFLGYALTLTNWVSIPAVMGLVFAVYGYRILVEEQALRERIGQPYAAYMARSYRLIPGIW
jgi:protein-S-isoprenylcysteine O-methyltransferase Ste14